MRDCHVIGKAASVLVHLQVDVASHSPGGGPAVSHDPIGLGRGAVVPHRHDAMVLIVRSHRAASSRGQDAPGVVVPSLGVHTNGHRRLLQCRGQALEVLMFTAAFSAGWNRVAITCDLRIATRELHVGTAHGFHLGLGARSGGGGLRQALLIGDVEAVRQTRRGLQVVVGTLREASIATLAAVLASAWSAAGNLLRRQLDVVPAA
mmetsp:Transcript_55174/g.87611  ORF Transcript_55174/g.87611 Transcript_55174/m.87611 type:complete len:205 (+) Transcript_55174:257-871(+)